MKRYIFTISLIYCNNPIFPNKNIYKEETAYQNNGIFKNMKEDLKNIILMGLGVMSLTNEKAQDLKKELLEKGSELYEKGKVANEELKHNIQEKMKENVTVVYEKNEVTKDDIIDSIKKLSDEDKKEIMEALKEKPKKNE